MCLVWNLTETPCKETACHGTFLWLLVTQVCGQVSVEASPGYSLLLEVLLCRHEYMNAHLFTPPTACRSLFRVQPAFSNYTHLCYSFISL